MNARRPVYEAATLDSQLDATARRVAAHFFAASPTHVTLPPSLRFYADDFGRGWPAAARRVAAFLGDASRAAVDARVAAKAPIRCAPFDCAPAPLSLLDDGAYSSETPGLGARRRVVPGGRRRRARRGPR